MPDSTSQAAQPNVRPGSITAMAIIYIVLGSILILVSLVLSILVFKDKFYVVHLVFPILFLSLGACHIAAGSGLLKLKKWSWYMAILFSVLYFGSLFGFIFVYVLHVNRKLFGINY